MEMTDRELLELIAAKVGGLETEVGGLETEVGGLSTRMGGLEDRMQKIEGTLQKIEGTLQKIDNAVINIETSHGEKLTALFDGYEQNTVKLDRIEKEVSKQEEIIMRRVK